MQAHTKTLLQNKNSRRGFTIVELLIVIVIIGILAAITVVAYNGIQQRAKTSTVMADLANSAKKMALDNVNNGSYALSAAAVDGGNGLPTSAGTTYQFHSTGSTYCVTGTNGTVSYKISDTGTTPTAGGCAGDGQGGVAAITNLITNPSMELGINGYGANNSSSTVSWSSAQAYKGTQSLLVQSLNTGNVYNGMSFPVTVTAGTTYTFSAWVYLPSAYSVGGVAATSNGAGLGVQQGNFVTTVGSWARTSVTFTPTVTGTAYLYVITSSGNTAPAGQSFYTDGFMLTQGTSTYNYADGSSPNWIWNGTPNSSTSTGPPV